MNTHRFIVEKDKKWFCFIVRPDKSNNFEVDKQVIEFLNKNPSLKPEDMNIIITDGKALVFYRAEEELY